MSIEERLTEKVPMRLLAERLVTIQGTLLANFRTQFADHAPLKLQPYGTIDICLLL